MLPTTPKVSQTQNTSGNIGVGEALAASMATLNRVRAIEPRGRVVQAFGTMLRVSGIGARIGSQCEIVSTNSDDPVVQAEVVGFADGHALVVPLSALQGVSLGAEVRLLDDRTGVLFGKALQGRVLDCFGQPLDGKPMPSGLISRPLHASAPNPLERKMIEKPFVTGVRAIDSLLTIGEGQRVGVFAAAGGGKSTLLGMLAQRSQAEVVVIALIGERGREVREFIEDSLGPEGLSRSVTIVSTSDRSAMERVRAAYTATAIAEGFRDQGARVLLLMDSVTRFARALREIGLAVGEPPVRRGFPPSVFAELPRLFERAGNNAVGSITAIYTTLLEDEDSADPVAEEVRSILDGHLVLSRALGQANHYPAIDVLASVSRTFTRVASAQHQKSASKVRSLMARHAEIKLLLQLGEYKAGADPLADEAIAKLPAIHALLKQRPDEKSTLETALTQMRAIAP